ncbi:MAG: dienelactone hydrolase family protein [Betaproteobacteria bacterium]|nr:dienelactone hydrolase family protein [Betaproteobacteria bacterium]
MAIVARKLVMEKDGISGYLACPRREHRGPALLWIHHNHGVTDNLKSEAYDYAELGYTAFVPNLYHLLGYPGAHHLGQGQDIQQQVSDPGFVEVIRKSWDYLVARDDVDAARVGVIGYCMGGRLGIHFIAANPQVRAFVAYYPSIKDEPETEIRPHHPIRAAREIKCPSLVIYGGHDRISSNEVQLKVWQSFLANGQPLEWHFYSEGLHGFVAPVSEGYQPELAKRVRPLAVDFLARQLADCAR